MEDIDITSPIESSEWGIPSPEAVREKSEKQKESYKKVQAQIQRAQKDEKKAKWDNDELFQILTRFIQNPYYEVLIPQVTDILSIALPSRPIIGMLALIYPEAAHHVIYAIWAPERIYQMQSLYRYDDLWIFQERDLHTTIRQWMSTWIDSFDRYIVIWESSIVMQQKFLTMIDASEKPILVAISAFVGFFFQSRNIVISLSTIDSYSRFILKNIRTTLQKSLQGHPDKDITQGEVIADTTLFWF